MSNDTKEFTLDELKFYNGTEGRPLYVLVDGKVYDVTTYAHPGGKDVFEQKEEEYSDLYDNFLEVGHSSTADRIMKKYFVGILKP